MKILFSCLLFIASISAHTQNNLVLNVTLQQPNFVITLPANPTTGFQWSVVSYDRNLLNLSSSYYEKPKNNLMGAGGQMHFTFTLQGKKYPKNTKITLKYARSWEIKNATVKEVNVNFIKNH